MPTATCGGQEILRMRDFDLHIIPQQVAKLSGGTSTVLGGTVTNSVTLGID